MNLSEFILLPEEDKKRILMHQGILIGKRKLEEHIIFLFQLKSFYIEVYCNLKDKSAKEYLAFNGTALLQPYLETITIDHLFRHNR